MRPSDNRLHFSDLKHIATTPREFWHKLTSPPKDTLSFRLGRHTHAKWLLGIDPPVWDSETKGKRDKRNPEYKALFDQYGETILNDTDYSRVLGMVRALDSHPLACQIKRLCTSFEKELLWTRSGIESAGHLDMCGPRGIEFYGEGWRNGILAELKSCESRRINPQAFQRQGEWYHYPEQCAWYSAGNGTLTNVFGNSSIEWPQCWVISVESSGAHDVVCHCLSDLRLDQANNTIDGWLSKYKECKESGRFPGWSDVGVPWDANVEFGSADADD
jgi:hypothetical protein